MNNNVFAIQFRMLEKCNADCDYCEAKDKGKTRLSVDDFKRSVDFIIESYLPERGATAGDHIDIEYTGGEITMYPLFDLEVCVDYARQAFADAGYSVGDSAQSNLVGSYHKVEWVWNKFNGNVNTTFDDFNGHRKLKGCNEQYKDKFEINVKDITGNIPNESSYMIDSSSINGLYDAVASAVAMGAEIKLQPVFVVNDTNAMPDLTEMSKEMCRVMNDWVLNKNNVSIEPLGQILRMVAFDDAEMLGRGDACPFVYGCASRSLCVQPNGDLYTCSNQALTGVNKLGNALESHCDESLIRKLSKRGIKLNSKCADCKYRAYCKGGCLNQAMLNGNHYDPSYFCDVWLALFDNAERLIELHGRDEIKSWLSN